MGLKVKSPAKAIAVTTSGDPYKSVGVGVAVCPLGEVPVETVHDAVLLLLLGAASRPLTNARSTSVGEHVGPHLIEGVKDAIALQGVAHEL